MLLSRMLRGAAVLTVLHAVLAPPLQAQMLSPAHALNGAPMSNFLSTSYLTQGVANALSSRERAPALLHEAARADAAALTVPVARRSAAAAKMALHYPQAQRAQAQGLFDDLLQRYAQIERQFGIPRGDLGGALAAFLAGSWMGLHNADFPDRQFAPVVAQMRGVLAAQPGLPQAPAADRQAMYEQLVIVGMLMAGTQMALKQQPDAQLESRMRASARGYLRQVLGADPERLRFTDEGIALR